MTEIKLKDAIKIIKAVKKLGVTKLKLGTLEFEISNESRAARPALKVSKKIIAEQDEKNQLQMDLDSAREELSTLHVEDPSGFERAIIENELDASGEIIEETYNL